LLTCKGILVHPKHLLEEVPEENEVIADVTLEHTLRLAVHTVEPFHCTHLYPSRSTLDVTSLKVDGSTESHPNLNSRHTVLVTHYELLLLRSTQSDKNHISTTLINNLDRLLYLIRIILKSKRRSIIANNNTLSLPLYTLFTSLYLSILLYTLVSNL